MIVIKVRGKNGNTILRSYYGSIAMEINDSILIVQSTRTYLNSNIDTYDCIYTKDVVAIWGN